ncbi:CCG-binding protein 1 [Tanacetum coccineum]
MVKDPPLIQKSENDIADYCSTLEGDRSYSCWRAYFELKDLEKEAPKEEVERMIIESRSTLRCQDGLPKSREEMEEEENGKMPDSPFTRLLRAKGKFPAWYSPAPDHETD